MKPPAAFVITVTGELDAVLRGQFDDVEVTVERGVSRLVLVDADTSALYGVLHRVEALGLEVLDVRQGDDMPGP